MVAPRSSMTSSTAPRTTSARTTATIHGQVRYLRLALGRGATVTLTGAGVPNSRVRWGADGP